jgi:Phospholipase_D-nuclease N-terminal
VLTLDEVKVLLGFLGVGLLIYAVIDCSRTPEAEVPSSLSRSGWLVLIIVLPFLGPAFWLLASRTEDAAASAGRSQPAARKSPPPRKGPPRGPDDDPDFLRGL